MSCAKPIEELISTSNLDIYCSVIHIVSQQSVCWAPKLSGSSSHCKIPLLRVTTFFLCSDKLQRWLHNTTPGEVSMSCCLRFVQSGMGEKTSAICKERKKTRYGIHILDNKFPILMNNLFCNTSANPSLPTSMHVFILSMGQPHPLVFFL